MFSVSYLPYELLIKTHDYITIVFSKIKGFYANQSSCRSKSQILFRLHIVNDLEKLNYGDFLYIYFFRSFLLLHYISIFYKLLLHIFVNQICYYLT